MQQKTYPIIFINPLNLLGDEKKQWLPFGGSDPLWVGDKRISSFYEHEKLVSIYPLPPDRLRLRDSSSMNPT